MLKKTTISTKTIMNIAYPIMIGNLAQTLISFVDTAFLGHIGNIELAASMMASLYYYVFATVAWGFSLGIQIIIARRFGEKNFKRIGIVFEHGALIVGVLAIGLVLTLGIFSEYLLAKVIDSKEIYACSMVYIKSRYFGIFFVCFNFLFRAFYVGISTTRVIIYSTILMASVNTFLDYCLIFGNFGFPEMGVRGAAIASVCAEISTLIFFTVYTIRSAKLKNYSLFKFKTFELSLFGTIIKLSVPKMLQALFSFSAWFVFFALIERLGNLCITSSSIIRSIYMLMLIPVFAFGSTANTLTSRIIGEGKSHELQALLFKIFRLALYFILPYITLCFLIPGQMASIYTDDAEIISTSIPVIYTICIATICMGFGIIYFEAVSGTGKTRAALFLEIFALVFYILYIVITTNLSEVSISLIWSVEIMYGLLIGLVSFTYLRFAHWSDTKV